MWWFNWVRKRLKVARQSLGSKNPLSSRFTKPFKDDFTSSEVSKSLLVNDMNPFASICYRVFDAHLLR